MSTKANHHKQLLEYTAEEFKDVLDYAQRERPDDYRRFLELVYSDPVLSQRLWDRTREAGTLSPCLQESLLDLCCRWVAATERPLHS